MTDLENVSDGAGSAVGIWELEDDLVPTWIQLLAHLRQSSTITLRLRWLCLILKKTAQLLSTC